MNGRTLFSLTKGEVDNLKKILMVSLILILFLSLSFSSVIFASNADQSELDSIKDRIEGVKDLLSQGQKKESSLSDQIDELDKQIEAAEKEIGSLQNDINGTQKNINQTMSNLNQTQDDIDSKNDVLKSRLRVMYKNGEVGIMEILLGSADFQEFMNNMDMIERICEQDVNLLKYLKEKYEEIDLRRKELEQLKIHLHQQKSDLQSKQDQLEVSRGEVAQLRTKVAEDNDALENQVDKLNQYASELAEKIREAQSDEAYVGGIFQWPAPGYKRITSYFGYRIHPILKVKKLHTGIDIGCPSGSTVVAANNGTVIHSNWLSGYGKTVMIDHGGGIVTLYAHNGKLLVSVGDKVKKGDTIAKSDSTGMSTGPHLHFEVRKDGTYVDPMTYFE